MIWKGGTRTPYWCLTTIRRWKIQFNSTFSHVFHSTSLIFTQPFSFSLDLSHFHSTFLIFTWPFSFSLDLSHFHSTSLTPIFTRPFSFHSTFLISLDLSHFHSTRPAFRALFKSMFAGARQCGWWTEVAWLDLFNIHWLGAALFRTGISATMSTKSQRKLVKMVLTSILQLENIDIPPPIVFCISLKYCILINLTIIDHNNYF